MPGSLRAQSSALLEPPLISLATTYPSTLAFSNEIRQVYARFFSDPAQISAQPINSGNA